MVLLHYMLAFFCIVFVFLLFGRLYTCVRLFVISFCVSVALCLK